MTASQPWQPPLLAAGQPVASITSREADVLTGICYGLTNRQIARRLDLSVDTVKTYLGRLYRSIGASDRCHAVALTASGQITIHVRETS